MDHMLRRVTRGFVPIKKERRSNGQQLSGKLGKKLKRTANQIRIVSNRGNIKTVLVTIAIRKIIETSVRTMIST